MSLKRICSMNTLSEEIFNYAKDVNNHGNGVIYYGNRYYDQYEMAVSFFSSAVGDLYNTVHQNGGTSLVGCPDEAMKEIGMAYMKIALLYKADRQEWYVNSVSAENAFYCLVRYFKTTGDSSSLPYLFILLRENKDLLKDKFGESWEKLNIDRLTRPFGPGLSDEVMLSACLRYYHVYVMRHILSLSYDIKKGRLLVEDNTFAFLYPDFNEMVSSFMKLYENFDKDEFAEGREKLGKTYFDTIYDLCKNVLLKY